MAVDFRAKAAKKADSGKKRITVGAAAEKTPKLVQAKSAIPDEERLLILPPSRFFVNEQVRRDIDQAEIAERAASFRSQGQLTPITVHPADENGNHLIIMGECRWRAAQQIPNFKLKAVIDPEAGQWDELKRIEVQITENDQRSPLTIMDMAVAISRLAEKKTHEEIATELGWVSKATSKPNVTKVNRYLSVLGLPEEGQALVKEKVVGDLQTLECLRKIHKVNPAKFSVLCDLAREDGLSRQRAEQEFKQCKSNAASQAAGPDNQAGRSGSETKQVAGEEGEGSASPASSSDLQGSAGKHQAGSDSETGNGTGSKAGPRNAETQRKKEGAKIQVEVSNRGPAYLCLLESPQSDGFAWVIMEDGERLHVEVSDLQITKVVC